MRIHAHHLLTRPLTLLLAALALTGCYPFLPSSGGGQTEFAPPRTVRAEDVALLEGYRIEAVATGLDFPTAVTFDDEGGIYVLEAGYSYGEVFATPRLLRLEEGGGRRVIASGGNPPWNGVDFYEGAFYIAEGGVLEGGRILRVTADGTLTPLLEGLPSLGDHHTNGPVVGPDGWLYFGQGTATNAAVVGLDNADYGWLSRFPDFHDTPCQNVILNGQTFTTANPLEPEGGEVSTGAFVPFGTATERGQVVAGALPCSGAVMRLPVSGGAPELVAWGFRNPFGLAFSPDGRLYLTDNLYDNRGSRPVWGAGDLLWAVTPGTWYGWPDFHGGRPLTDSDFYGPPDGPAPDFLLAEHPNAPPRPDAVLGVHSSSVGLDFSRDPAFGYLGQAFIAQFGDLAPEVGKVLGPVGYKVVRVDVTNGITQDFAVNRAEPGSPASKSGGGGLERPVDVRFDPSGSALYVVDFGVMTVSAEGPEPRLGTGVLWRISREEP